MAQIIKHRKVSTVADGTDATQIQPSNWNDGLVASGGVQGNLLMYDPAGDATYNTNWSTGLSWDIANMILKIGGATAAFPAFKRNSTQIDLRLADDSGYAHLRGGSLTAIDDIRIGIAPALSGALRLQYAGYLKARNSDNTADRFLLGLDTGDGNNQIMLGDSGVLGIIPGSGDNSLSLGTVGRRWASIYAYSFFGTETTDYAAPPANAYVLYARDNGGKTELVARFATGAIQQVAIQP